MMRWSPLPEELRGAMERLADRLSTVDGALAMSQLQAHRLISRQAAPRPLPGKEGRVGIWEQVGTTERWVRSETLRGDWRLWADVGEILPKRAKRIAWIGESTAR